MITDEVSVWHVREFLAVLAGQLNGRRNFVRNEIIHETGARSSRISQPHDLNRRRPRRENLISRPFCVPIHIHQYVNAVSVNAIRGFAVARNLRQVHEMLRFLCDLGSESSVVVGAESVTENFDVPLVMEARDGLHQMTGRVVSKVRGNVPNFQPRAHFSRVFERLMVEYVDLQEYLTLGVIRKLLLNFLALLIIFGVKLTVFQYL